MRIQYWEYSKKFVDGYNQIARYWDSETLRHQSGKKEDSAFKSEFL